MRITHSGFLTMLLLAVGLACASGVQAASTLQFTESAYTVGEGDGAVTLAVSCLPAPNAPTTVDFATADGTATAGLKYTATNGTLTFGTGETSKTIMVPILNNGLVEEIIKTFQVNLSHPTSDAVLGARAGATVNIRDNDVGVQFQFVEYSTASYNPVPEDAGVVLIGVVRGDDGNLPVTVDIATVDGTAIQGLDYVGLAETLSFAPQERLKFVAVRILNDNVREGNKSFGLTLSNPLGLTLGLTKTTTVTILDNDRGFQFEAANCYVAEDAGVALLGVLRGTDDTNSTVTVDFAISDSSAISGLDYAATNETLSFAPGERRKVVPVRVVNDGLKEPTETFRVRLANPTEGAVLGSPASITVSIWDNDPGVGFELRSYTNAWGEGADFAVTVLRGNDGALGPITVDYATRDGTAKAGEDYQAVSGTLVLEENATVKNLTVPILRPRPTGSPKTFRVMLSHPTGGATLGTWNTTVNIAGAYATVAPPFDTALTIRREWGANVLTWAGGGQLLRADKLTGPWQTLSAVTNPCTVQSPVPTTFYRVTLPRPVSVYIPSSYDSKTNLPLVILLHGYSGDGVWEESYMQFQPLAEARGFLYCCPDGTFDRAGLRYWNGVGVDDFWNEQVNDAGYLRAVIEQIGQQFALDRKRVYLIGHSAGGDMSYEAACKSADLIAGIATLAGVTYLDPVSCQPSEPVNVLCICGTADELTYYGGSWWYGSPPLAFSPAYPGVVRTVQIWAGYNGARQPVMDPAPTLDLIANVNGLDTVVTRYTEAVRGGAVELWTIKRGQHTPPLSSQFAPLIIDWLLAHPKP